MAIDERARHRLHERLAEVLGPEEAATLMQHLPPVGWGDVATKLDLDQLSVATKQDLVQLKLEIEAELHRLRADLVDQMATQAATYSRSLLIGNSVAILTVGGLATAAARLA